MTSLIFDGDVGEIGGNKILCSPECVFIDFRKGLGRGTQYYERTTARSVSLGGVCSRKNRVTQEIFGERK